MNGPYREEPFDPENPVVYQPYVNYSSFHRIRSGLKDYGKDEWAYQPREIKRFDRLPEKIRTIATQVLEDSLQQWADKVTFHSARIYQPERFFKDEVRAQSNYHLVPRYQLWFVFSFPEMRVKEYCFEVSFDKLGQVLKFDFPRYLFHLEQTLYHYDRAQELARAYVAAKKYKPVFFNLELKYAADSGQLNWKFYYLQKELDSPGVNQKKIRMIIVDLTAQMVIFDRELHSTSNKIPAHKEKRTCISETIWNGERIQIMDVAISVEEPQDQEAWPAPPEP
ncbi:hypothetical protein [Niabella drilacis]|uniref:Uncharacterized protein n=1 Tax=Niabella drilacis (strain DSM 25811 / CCM 8410 / CCUG 62505 / LMG 26954 / E90) TaxID=1285928 RepID=A0A1G6IPE4_NIADE|nr:hypothetical protein [Niabella drilacis]SDC08347.1 hypothetical protein SAMN04487894_101290 [Niabella drilacis]